jgi:hypothetical protein
MGFMFVVDRQVLLKVAERVMMPQTELLLLRTHKS